MEDARDSEVSAAEDFESERATVRLAEVSKTHRRANANCVLDDPDIRR